MRDLKVLSLFSGIGGLERGLEMAGVGRTVAQCEFDPFASSVLARHWPEAERFRDVRELAGEDVGSIDLICGGFPCQPWSTAGKRKGKDDERHLWPAFARLVRELRPSWVVGENVAALLSGGIGEPLADLSAAGYDVAWDCVPAAAVGAPHRRDRVFLIAWRRDVCSPPLDVSQAWADAVRAVREQPAAWPAGTWPTPKRWDADRGDCPSERARRSPSLVSAAVMGTMWPAGPRQPQHEWEPPRVAKGVKDRAKRLRCLGNAVVPQVAEAVGRALLAIGAGVGSNTARPMVARLDGGRWVAPQGGLFDVVEVSRFPRAGTVRGGVAYELTPCAPLSSLEALGSSMAGECWPTACATDATGTRNLTAGRSNPNGTHSSGVTLSDAMRLWPTPQAADDMDMPAVQRRVAAGKQVMLTMAARNAVDIAPLNPAWVEALMGLPVGWTDSAPVEASTQRQASTSTARLRSQSPEGGRLAGGGPLEAA